MNKKKYINPTFEKIDINSKDIISTSNFGNYDPFGPEGEDDF